MGWKVCLAPTHLSRANVDTSGVGMAPAIVRLQAVVDSLTFVPICPPPPQTLARVSRRARLHTLGLGEAFRSGDTRYNTTTGTNLKKRHARPAECAPTEMTGRLKMFA